MSAEPVRRRKNRKANTSLGIPHTFSFPLLPTHECGAVNLHMMTLKILFHMDVKWRSRRSGFGPISHPRDTTFTRDLAPQTFRLGLEQLIFWRRNEPANKYPARS